MNKSDEEEPIEEDEVAKRLTPKGDVLRELFLKCGNLCAFPGCDHLIMSPEGKFIGELCHIEAAEKGGERFNKDQTNDQRRAVENLLLMCHRHHVETDDVAAFPVPRMQQMKADHEKRVFEFASQLQFKVSDLTKREIEKPSKLPRKMATALEWNLSDEHLVDTAAGLNVLLAALKEVPLQARQLLEVAVARSRTDAGSRIFYPSEVDLACGLTWDTTASLYAILDRIGFTDEGWADDYGRPQFSLYCPGCEWDVWGDFLNCQKAGIVTLHELIVELNFALLDSD